MGIRRWLRSTTPRRSRFPCLLKSANRFRSSKANRSRSMHIALITAGGAGMFCGSCMHDNTLARALIAAGHEVSLIPTYTPIRVDEQDVSTRHVYLGGINVYLDALVPMWNRLPRAATR